MRIAILGASGQLGRQLTSLSWSGGAYELLPLCRDSVDLSKPECIHEKLDLLPPADLIINAAAYTAVDKAESEPELADAINHLAVEQIARYCEQHNIILIHVSTDFVFDGIFDGHPPKAYLPEASLSPLGVYGHTKAAGEQVALKTTSNSYIVRTSWVYGEHGHNFVKTMLRLGSERDELSVVSDQIGAPTYAANLALYIWCLIDKLIDKSPGQIFPRIWHYSDAGVASWYDFAVAIFEEAQSRGLIESVPSVRPITSDLYPTLAQRPAFSLLSCVGSLEILGASQPHWRVALRGMLNNLHHNNKFKNSE